MRTLVIFGASGSIGSQTLQLLKNELNQTYKLIGITVGHRIVKIPAILNDFPSVKYICVEEKMDYEMLRVKYPKIKFYYGDDGLINLLKAASPEMIVNSLVGFVGLVPTIEAIKANIDIGLANKESLVIGGDLIEKELKKSTSKIYPIDSEHVAIEKCLDGAGKKEVDQIVLTCSGGPFLFKKFNKLNKVSIDEALSHPTWLMGDKITIDSATLINKVFEEIEAYYLFKNYTENIKVVFHPQSIVHSLVKFKDGSYLADIGERDMKSAIYYALCLNKRKDRAVNFNIEDAGNLTFIKPDKDRQEILSLSDSIIRNKGNLGAILVSADDICVNAFLNSKINFASVVKLIKLALDNIPYIQNPKIKDMIESKEKTEMYLNKLIESGLYL